MAKMIIFDYGRTLYDRETDDFFPDAIPVVRTLAEKYRLIDLYISNGIASHSCFAPDRIALAMQSSIV